LDLTDLRQLLLVLDEDGARLGVVEHVVALLRGVGLVDRDRGRAGGQDREVGVGPLRARVAEDRDTVTLADAEADEPPPNLADDLTQLLESDVDPVVAHLVAKGDPGTVLGRGQRSEVGHRRGAGARLPSGPAEFPWRSRP